MSEPQEQKTNSSEPDDPEITRRTLYARIALWLSGLIGALVTIPVVAYILGPIFKKPPREWRRVASVDDLEVGQTILVHYEDSSPMPWAGVTARTGAWLRRETDSEFIAFSINCRHLGCPVRWVEGAELFMCPCHGGVYYKDGEVAAGPPPKPLHRYPVRVRQGNVEIETSPVPLPSSS